MNSDRPDMVDGTPEVVVVQSLAMVDHVCKVDVGTLASLVERSETGGSRPVPLDKLSSILARVGEFHSKAGGSSANTARALASLFRIRCDLVRCPDSAVGLAMPAKTK